MTEPRRMHWLDWLLLMGVTGIATLFRAGYLHECANAGSAPAPLLVQDVRPTIPNPAGKGRISDYDSLIGNLTSDTPQYSSFAPLSDQQQERTAHIAPGYIWLLAAADSWFDEPHMIVRWTQCVLGALTAIFCFLFARQAFNSTLVAVIAGVLAALHPFWIINTAEINDGVLITFLFAASLFLGTRASQTGASVPGLFFGLALAGSCLVRAIMLPFALLAMMWFLLHSRHVKKGWFCALLAFLGFANGLAPWMVRNFQTFDRPVPVADSAYYHLWVGNNPVATGGPIRERDLQATLKSERLDVLVKMNQSQRYDSLSEEVLHEVANDPSRTITRRLWAGLYFVFGQAWFDNSVLAQQGVAPNGTPASLPEWFADTYEGILSGVMLGMLVLGVLGWRWSFSQYRRTQLAAIALIWIPLPYVLSHGEMLSGPRLPLDAVLLTLSAFALANLIPGMAGKLAAPIDDEI